MSKNPGNSYNDNTLNSLTNHEFLDLLDYPVTTIYLEKPILRNSLIPMIINSALYKENVIYFDFDNYNLTDVSSNSINKFVEEYKNIIDTFLVVGHTDTKGTKKYNLELSIKRAEAVKTIMIRLGISPEKIRILGEGESKLLVKTKDETKHPANRRAEISPSN